MKPRLLIIFLLLVGLPLVAIGGIGYAVAREKQAIVEHRYRELLRGRLAQVDATLGRLIERIERELLGVTVPPLLEPEALRALARRDPRIAQAYVLNAKGELLFPADGQDISRAERDFLERTRLVWQRGDLTMRGPVSHEREAAVAPGNPAPDQTASRRLTTGPAHGWYPWYWGDGLRFLFWRRHGDGRIVGVELERVRLLADVIAALPDTDPSGSAFADARLVLRDANGRALYQWGLHEPAETDTPAAGLPLSHPLGAWRLDYYVPPELLAAGAPWFNLVAALVACGGVLVLLAVYFGRETGRELREAGRRVNFVNQVSHELKTPLTNIRMYAELLGDRVGDEGDSKTDHYLGVIVEESRRLSRLIGNVLTFGRSARRRLAVRPLRDVVDERLGTVLEQFRPSFTRKGIDVTTELHAGGPVLVDGDALEQIVGNLLNNVEKYAANGGAVSIASRHEGEQTLISVADRGPGVPPREAERIFQPFHRLSDKINEGAAGTGIGLTIARELARLHGGHLRLVPSDQGACFELRLRTPRATQTQEALS